MNVDRRLQRLSPVPERVQRRVIEILAIGVTVDHCPAKLQFAQAALQLRPLQPPRVLHKGRRDAQSRNSGRRTGLSTACNGIDVLRTKVLVYIITAAADRDGRRLHLPAAAAHLARRRISVNDWTAFVIFITVIGGIGGIEGPIVGTIVFFALRQTLTDLGTIYLLTLGAVAILVMLMAPKAFGGSSSSASAGRFFRSSAASSSAIVASSRSKNPAAEKWTAALRLPPVLPRQRQSPTSHNSFSAISSPWSAGAMQVQTRRRSP